METTEDAVSYTAFRFPPSGVALVLGNEETRTRARSRNPDPNPNAKPAQVTRRPGSTRA